MSKIKLLIVILVVIFLFLTNCSEEQATEPQSPSDEIILQDNVKEFKDADLTEIANITSTNIEFKDSTVTKDLKIGSIIVGGISEKTPFGFLRKVINISNDKTSITTEYASLDELIKSGKLEIKSSMFPKILQKKSLNKGFILKPFTNGGFNFYYAFENFVVYDLDNNFSTTNDQLRINGDLDFSASMDMEVNFLSLNLDLTSEVITELTLMAEAELTGIIDKEKKVGELYFTPLTIGPVVVTPVIESFVGIKGNLSASASAGISDILTIEAGITYSGGWEAGASIDNQFTFNNIEVSLDGTLRGYVKAKLSFILYEVVGPSIYASPYLEGQININQTPWWKLYAGSEGGIGINMGRIISFISDYEYPLVDYPILLAQAESVPNTAPSASFTVSPESGSTSTIFNFDASGSSDNEDNFSQLRFSWDWENDGTWDVENSTNHNPTHQYSSSGNYTVKFRVIDSGDLFDETISQVSVSSSSGETGTVTDIDGNTYQTIKIGNQWWMAENLKATHYRNSDPIPNVTDNNEWINLTTGAYCVYDNNSGNVATYGLLYNWYALDDSRNIAPSGWHVPTDEEWKQLEKHLGMSQNSTDSTGRRGLNEGGKLKETGSDHWSSPNIGATNESGFTALPGGIRFHTGFFSHIVWGSFFWTATDDVNENAWWRGLNYTHSFIYRSNFYTKQTGMSIRCIKD
jgi:uncharacterized protein (TIGR02145 family)